MKNYWLFCIFKTYVVYWDLFAVLKDGKLGVSLHETYIIGYTDLEYNFWFSEYGFEFRNDPRIIGGLRA